MKTILIPAFTTFPGGGLMHFLLQAVRALAACRPDWKLVLIGSISMETQPEELPDNVNVRYIDNDRFSKTIYELTHWLLKPSGKSQDTGYLLQSRFERLRWKWGNIGILKEYLPAADVIWIPNYSIVLDQIALYPLLQGSNIPILTTIHDIHPAFYPEDHSPQNLKRFYQGFVPFAQDCSAIITHSEYQKAAIQHHLQIPAEKIYVTPQPPLIDPTRLLQVHSDQPTGDFFKATGQHPFVFYPASTTHVHKNHTRLLVAWSLLKQQLGEQCPLLVCTGKGSRRQWQGLQSLIAGFDLQDRVIFTGPVSTPILAALYQHCQFVILPTLYEGAGSGILTDAYLMGKPVLSSPLPQIQEQLTTLHDARIQFMASDSVIGIVNAVLQQLHKQNEGQQADPIQAADRKAEFQHLWQVWAKFYTEKMEQLAR